MTKAGKSVEDKKRASTKTYCTLPDGGQIAYRLQGTRSGMPVVFLNGILMNLHSWEVQTEAFRDHLCLTHDFRGQLYSDSHFPSSPSLKQHVEDLLFLLDHLEIERCRLVGTSYGGEVALLFSKMHPERVKSLSIVASVSYSDALLKKQVQLWKDLAGQSAELLFDSVAGLCYSARFLEKNAGLVEKRRRAFAQLPSSFFTGFQRLCDAFLTFSLTPEELTKIILPAQVIAAEKDILKLPHYSRTIAEHLPFATYLEIPDAGHAVIVEKPMSVNYLLKDFFEREI